MAAESDAGRETIQPVWKRAVASLWLCGDKENVLRVLKQGPNVRFLPSQHRTAVNGGGAFLVPWV